MEKDNLIREYGLSFLSAAGCLDGNKRMFDILNDFFNFIDDNYEGESFTDKTISLVKSLGVTDEEISSIRRILIK